MKIYLRVLILTKLQSLRESQLKGNFVRSRVQWLQSGEKPSQYFCSLEQKIIWTKPLGKFLWVMEIL